MCGASIPPSGLARCASAPTGLWMGVDGQVRERPVEHRQRVRRAVGGLVRFRVKSAVDLHVVRRGAESGDRRVVADLGVHDAGGGRWVVLTGGTAVGARLEVDRVTVTAELRLVRNAREVRVDLVDRRARVEDLDVGGAEVWRGAGGQRRGGRHHAAERRSCGEPDKGEGCCTRSGAGSPDLHDASFRSSLVAEARGM